MAPTFTPELMPSETKAPHAKALRMSCARIQFLDGLLQGTSKN
jgi:hypothetical protein